MADDINAAERLNRIQFLRAIVHLTADLRGAHLADEQHRAECDASRFPAALVAFNH